MAIPQRYSRDELLRDGVIVSRSGDEIKMNCPQCGKNSFNLNQTSGLYHCWHPACGLKGIATESTGSRPEVRPRERRVPAQRIKIPMLSACADAQPLDDKALRRITERSPLRSTPGEAYLATRGIPVELAHAAGVRFIAKYVYPHEEPGKDEPIFLRRPGVLIPITALNGTSVAYQVRFIDGLERDDVALAAGYSCPLSKVTGKGRKKDGVFATPGAIVNAELAEPVTIVEGAIDALTLALIGKPAIALCGCEAPGWLSSACFNKTVNIGFDNDDDPSKGEAAASKLKSELEKCMCYVRRLRPEGAKDWNDLLVGQGIAATKAVVFGSKTVTRDPLTPYSNLLTFARKGHLPLELCKVAITASTRIEELRGNEEVQKCDVEYRAMLSALDALQRHCVRRGLFSIAH